MDEQFQINGVKAENEEENYPAPETRPIPPQINYTEPVAPQKKPKIRRWKSFLIILGIIAAAESGYLVWNHYLSPEAKENRKIENDFKAYMRFVDQYETAMKNDTYGGQTPQETLDMFIDALENGDLELASKYFVLREDGSRDPEILSVLQEKLANNSLNEIINIAKDLRPSTNNTGSENTYIFVVLNDQGMAQYSMFLAKNQYSQLWKIESL